MTTKTYPQLTATITVADGDLFATYSGAGPLKRITALLVQAYMQAGTMLLTGTEPMTGALKLAVGSEGAPGLTFDGDPDVGLYRIGANDMGVTVGGVKQGEWTATGYTARPSTVTGPGLSLPPGVAPTSPADGDAWTTTGGFFIRINGVSQRMASVTGKLTFAASTTAEASANVPVGVAPTVPVDGDLWNDTTLGLAFEDNGGVVSLSRTPISLRTANTIIDPDDMGTLIVYTANSFNQTFPTAADFGPGARLGLMNTGAGIIGIVPFSGDTVTTEDGTARTTTYLYPGERAFMVTNGVSNWQISRPSGPVLTQSQTVGAAVASLSFEPAFADPEMVQLTLIGRGVSAGTAGVKPGLQLKQSGAYVTSYHNMGGLGSATADAAVIYLLNNTVTVGTGSVINFSADFRSIAARAGPFICTDGQDLNLSTLFCWTGTGRSEDVTAIQGVKMLYSSGNISAGTLELYGMRRR